MDLVEKESKIPQDAIGSQFLAYNAMQLAWKISLCQYRLLETSAVDGMNQYSRAMELAERNADAAFEITPEKLLEAMRKAYRKYPGKNQKELCVHVADALGNEIGGERVRKLLQEYKIRKTDYEK